MSKRRYKTPLAIYFTLVLATALVAWLPGCSDTPVGMRGSLLDSKLGGHVIALRFSPDGGHLFSSESFRWKSKAIGGSHLDGVLSRWDLANGKITNTVPFRYPSALAVDGELLAVGTANWSAPRPGELPRAIPAYRNVGSVHLLDAKTLGAKGHIPLEQGVVGLAFIPKSHYLAAYCINSENTVSVFLIDVESQSKVASRTLTGQPIAIEHRGAVQPLVYSKINGGSLIVLNPTKPLIPGEDARASNDEESKRAIRSAIGGELLVLSVPSLSLVRSIAIGDDDCTFVDATDDGTFTVVASESCRLGTIGTSDDLRAQLKEYGTYVAAAFILNDSDRTLVFNHRAVRDDAASVAGSIVDLSSSKDQTIARLRPQENHVLFSAAISDDRRKAACSGNDGVIQIWSLSGDESNVVK
ncbi:WD40 repeat domain-containing protein [Lacipirellula limnantheis]|uniref:WD40 repeat domain-containing protein n=1 Tax=Lacipirellula limnantheis TaxID=2528024 RepID=UPI0011A33EA5|nr:hypothetical protein [Lacipirellula limnantheis]